MRLITLTQLASECYAQLIATPEQVRAALPNVTPDEKGMWLLQDAQGRKGALWATGKENGTDWRAAGNTALIHELLQPAPSRARRVLQAILNFFN